VTYQQAYIEKGILYYDDYNGCCDIVLMTVKKTILEYNSKDSNHDV